MADPSAIPRAVIPRMSSYLRQLERLERQGVETISSAELGEAIGASDAQVRKDLTYFGQFGQRGVGYNVGRLIRAIRSILGLDDEWHAALVGAGNIGRALCTYKIFPQRGFRIVALFDSDPRKEGCTWARLKVRSMRDLPRVCREMDIDLGIIAVPAEGAQEVADQLVEAGLRGILNFAPARISVPPGVEVCTVDLAVELEQLAFLVRHAAGAR
ncbi:MAG: redox-sensing transcriptional repressor Rex [Candidatus Brocadiia bacterium]